MNIEAWVQSARTDLMNQNYQQALATCQQILCQSPQNAIAYKILGDIYATQQQFNEAMSAYNQAIERQPQWAEPYAYLAQLYRNFGGLDEAVTFYKKALERQPGWSEIHCQLGHTLHWQGEIEAAIRCYENAISHNPNYAEGYFYLATRLSERDLVEAAIAAYRKVLDLCPDSIGTYNNLGCLLIKEERYTEALDVFQQAIALSPKRGILYNNLAQALMGLERIGEAIAAYKVALELEPDLVLAYQNLGKLWQRENQHDVAISYFKTVLELESNDLQAYSDCGQSFFVLGQLEPALACFQRAIALDPRFVEAFCQEVENCPDSQQYGDELSLSQKACARFFRRLQQYNFNPESSSPPQPLEPLYQDWAQIYYHLGNTLVQYGEFKKAVEYYKNAIHIQPQCLDYYFALADSLCLDDQLDTAIIIYQIADQIGTRLKTETDQEIPLTGKMPVPLTGKMPVPLTGKMPVPQLLINSQLSTVNCQQTGKMPVPQLFINTQHSTLNTQHSTVNCQRSTVNCQQTGKMPVPQYRLIIYWKLGQIAEQQKRWKSALDYYGKVLEFQDNFWVDLPIIKFPANEIALKHNIPQGIYDSTGDWLATHNLHHSHYISLETQSSVIAVETLEKTELPAKCGGLDCGVCLKRIEQKFNPKHLGAGLYGFPERQNLDVKFSPKFVATIPNGRAWIVPQQNYWMICNAIAIITPDEQLLADVSREYPGQLPGCAKYDISQHRIFNSPQLPPLQFIEGNVAVLSGLSGNVYFHWMVDILPRLELLRRSGINWDTIDWFVVNSLRLPFQRESLEQLGVPGFKILESDRIPHFQAQQLIVPSFAGYLGWIEPWAIEFLRREFLKGGNAKGGNYPERIYIRRRKANHRRVINEDEILDTLRPLGFVDLDLETLSFAEQIALFSQVKVILTPHGSGLTNTLFCSKEGVKVIEIVSPHYNRHYYWVISHYLKLEHYYLVGEGFACYPLRSLMYQNPLTEDIWVNLTSLKKLLRTIGLQE